MRQFDIKHDDIVDLGLDDFLKDIKEDAEKWVKRYTE